MDEGAFDMDVQLLPGISLDKALDLTNLIEKKLKTFPGTDDRHFTNGTDRDRS